LWTGSTGGGPRPRHSATLAGVGPPATSGHESSQVGAENGGQSTGGPVSGLIGARVAAWWPGNGDEEAIEKKHGGSSAHTSGEGKTIRGGCDENKRKHLPFIGAVRR
jgi:hypothetical protein